MLIGKEELPGIRSKVYSIRRVIICNILQQDIAKGILRDDGVNGCDEDC